MNPPDGPGREELPGLLSRLLNDARVQDCLWVALMEWGLRIDKVALRPRTATEGGTRPDGWVLWIGLGSGVRLEVNTGPGGEQVGEVRLRIDPATAPRLMRRRAPARSSMDPAGRAQVEVSGHDTVRRP